MVDHPTPTNGARCRPLVDTIARHPSPHSFETFDPAGAHATLLASGGMHVPPLGIGPAAFTGREVAR